jgi:hypothetical protein
MVAVAIAALDLAALRTMFGSRTSETLLLGALPMANILAVGILVGQQRPGSRPFLLGFEAFGAMAVALFVALVIFLPYDAYDPIRSSLALWIEPMEKVIGWDRPFLFVPIACFGIVVMLGWPQVAFALLGGLLSRRFKITSTHADRLLH